MSDSYGYEVCSDKQSGKHTIVIMEGDRDGASKVVSQMDGRKVGDRVRIIRPDVWVDDDSDQTKTAVEAEQ
jgi:hypothetical protein